MKILRFVARHSSLILNLIWTAIFLAAISSPILLEISPKAGMCSYMVLRPLCHQAEGRCYNICGHKMGLCTRCTGVFFGLALFGWLAVGYRIKKPIRFEFFVLSMLPLIIDGAGNLFEIWSTCNHLRFVTGIPFAFGVVFWIYPFIFKLERPEYPVEENI
jgi:uncharacterized membrane protein